MQPNTSPETHHAQYEYLKMQFMGSLGQMANNLRECATVADQFAQIIGSFQYNGNPPAFPPLTNGQFPMPIMSPLQMAQVQQGKKRKSRLDDTTSKRQKKQKDPNAPKRPPSSYILFQNDVRGEVKASNPNMSNNEVLATISRMWGKIPPDQKDVYESRNREAKDKWLKTKAIYDSGGVSAQPVMAMNVAEPVAAAAETPSSFVAGGTSSDEVSGDEDDSSDETSEAEVALPPPKKKKELVAPAKDESSLGKEKKHKKPKA